MTRADRLTLRTRTGRAPPRPGGPTPPAAAGAAGADPAADGLGVGDRLRAWRRRHLLRERRAQDYFAASRRPERGLPVADRHAVWRLLRESRCISTRRRWSRLLVLHALAAVAGLSCPGSSAPWSTRRPRRARLAATLTGLALAVAGVVVVQAVLTFFALRMSVGLRPGPAGRRPGVRRAHGARPAAGPGGERQLRRPGHPGHPGRGHDEPERPLRPAGDGDRQR